MAELRGLVNTVVLTAGSFRIQLEYISIWYPLTFYKQ